MKQLGYTQLQVKQISGVLKSSSDCYSMNTAVSSVI